MYQLYIIRCGTIITFALQKVKEYLQLSDRGRHYIPRIGDVCFHFVLRTLTVKHYVCRCIQCTHTLGQFLRCLGGVGATGLLGRRRPILTIFEFLEKISFLMLESR